MNKDLSQIKAIPIIEVANRLGIDVRRDKRAMCIKGHDRKTPSLSFNTKENYFKCFGCGIGGSTIDLVMAVKGCETKEAIIWIADNFHISLGADRSGYLQKSESGFRISRAINTSFTTPKPVSGKSYSEIYERLLSLCPLTDKAKYYLKKKRGFTDETISKAMIGLLDNRQSIFKQLVDEYGMSELADAGLVKEYPNNPRFIYWDRCLIFPFFEDDHIVYLQARRAEGSPKYLNLTGKVVKPVYNRDCLKSLSSGSRLYVCEGIPDTLTMIQSGRDAIGVLGVQSFKNEYIRLLEPYEIVLCGDGDQAGQTFNQNAGDLFRKHGKIVKAIILPQGKDVNEVVAEGQHG